MAELRPNDEELNAAMKEAEKLASEGKLVPAKLEPVPDNLLRVVCREVDGQKRRCSTFIHIPDHVGDDFRSALKAAHPTLTVFTYDEAERMAERAAEQQRDRLLAFIREHRSEAEERGATANDRWLYGMAAAIEGEVGK